MNHLMSADVKATALVLMTMLMANACGDKEKDYDATGTFESTEITVSAEQNGKIWQLNIEEGDKVSIGQQVGLIDTVQLYLKARQLGVTKSVYASQRPDKMKQIAVLKQQLAKAEQDMRRYAGLVKEGAANRKLLDDATSQVNVLKRNIAAQSSTLDNSTNSLNAQMSAADVQRQQVMDQLAKCHIVSPASGTVLEKYAEAGEFATVGKPLFKVADMDRMYLRAYITSEQLKNVKIGQNVKVYSDFGNKQRRQYDGVITWIASKSEFTPKTILTDNERADLVYAVKIAVKNDGYIKIGMYGEVKL